MRFITIVASTVALAGTCWANPTPPTCSTGSSQQCCKSLNNPSNPTISNLLAILGLSAPIGTLVGLNCVPLLSGCSDQAACCSGPQNGLVNLGCTQIAL